MFIHLHNHSDYSLLDGACKINELVSIAVEQNAPAIGLTDHGNMHGAIEFYKTAVKAEIKPIIGCELYLAQGSRTEKTSVKRSDAYYHQVLFAKNEIGYKNLSFLSSEGFLSGYYYKPRIDKELLAKHNEGIICLSSCLQGEIPQLIINNEVDKAVEAVKFYKELFGDDFYIELMRHGLEVQEGIIPQLLEFAHDFNIKLVATNDAHYTRKEHAGSHDILLCIGTQRKLSDHDRMRFDTQEFYLKTPEEMADLFSDLPEAIENTNEIAEKVNLKIDLKKKHFPVFQLDENLSLTHVEYFRKIVEEGFLKRYGNSPTQEMRDRLELEFKVIVDAGYESYFLIVSDFVQWAKARGIRVGPGRGSAAGCIISYCLNITNIDPLEYGLIFERFLNPERISPPDIDIDFADDRREEVIQYVRQKYGENCVVRITTFGKMAAKSAFKDVARVMDIPVAETEAVAKLIPEGPKVTLEQSLKDVAEFKQIVTHNPKFAKVIEHALVLEGLHRHASTHAAGVIITPGPAIDYAPMYKQSDSDEIFTQYEMGWIDDIGLLKIDFLGLQTLTEIDITVRTLAEKGIEIDLDKITYDDPKVFKLFGDANMTAVFQFESPGMRKNLIKLKPTILEDLIAMNALYRPGPMHMIEEYILRKHGKHRVEYKFPELMPILKDTLGVIVYQEQVMRIATDIGGLSLGQADNLRSAMGKKKKDVMAEIMPKFEAGAKAHGIPADKLAEVKEEMDQFSSYGFVKAHSAGYAVIAYQCAYLKVYYPNEYFSACLTVRHKNTATVMKLLSECKQLGVTVLPPDINESKREFWATDKGIRFGLCAIRNVGENAVKAIQVAVSENGTFKSFADFLMNVDLKVVNKRALESLIDAGAFASFGYNRKSLHNSLESTLAYVQITKEMKNSNQSSLFGGLDEFTQEIPPPDIFVSEEFSSEEFMDREKQALGYYLSKHPLENFTVEIENLTTHLLEDEEEFREQQSARLCCVITEIKKRKTRVGMMTSVKMEDLTGEIEGIIFKEENAEKFTKLLKANTLVGVSGKFSSRNNEKMQILIDELIPLQDAMTAWSNSIVLRIRYEEIEEKMIKKLEAILKGFRGNLPFYLEYIDSFGDVLRFRLDKYYVKITPELVNQLATKFGVGNVRVSR